MGYLIVGLLAIVLIFFLVTALARGKPSGNLPHTKPVVRDEPSAEEANPSASVTASPRQKENARGHTPPA